MFNFSLQNRAFEELNAEQFRMIYFLNSTLSMVNKKHNTPNNNKIEMFNGYMMDKLGLCERQIQRLIKDLEKLGYISVERAKTKKTPNNITINSDINDDIHCDKNGDKNVTLNKKEIKNNNKSKEGNIPVQVKPEQDVKKESMEQVKDVNQNLGKVTQDDWINLQEIKDNMYKAKSQDEYDKAIEDLNLHMRKIETNTPSEVYQEYRQNLKRWYMATLPYLKFDKNYVKPEQDTTPKGLEELITYDLHEAHEQYEFKLDQSFMKYITNEGRVDCPKIEDKIDEAFAGMLHTKNKDCYEDHLNNISKYIECLTLFMSVEDGDTFVQRMNNRLDGVKKYRKDKGITFTKKYTPLEEETHTDMLSECAIIPISA